MSLPVSPFLKVHDLLQYIGMSSGKVPKYVRVLFSSIFSE